MSNKEQLIIEINHSRQLLCLLFVIHGLATVALISLALPLLATVLAILPIVFSLDYTIKKTREVIRVVAGQDDEWFIRRSDGSSFSAHLSGNTYVSDWLTLLAFSSYETSSATYVLLMTDSINTVVLSQLKLRLKVSNKQLEAISHNGSTT